MEIDIKVSGNDKITIKLEEKRDKKENNIIIGKRAGGIEMHCNDAGSIYINPDGTYNLVDKKTNKSVPITNENIGRFFKEFLELPTVDIPTL